MLDEVGRQEAIHRGRLALVHDFLDEAADELLVCLAIRGPGGGQGGEARQDGDGGNGGSHRKAHDDLLFGFIARY